VITDAVIPVPGLGTRLEEDQTAFARRVDGSFDARARMLTLDRSHVEMVEIARRAGAAANYTGAGGAIVCACRDESLRSVLAEAPAGAECGVISR
jgi:hypothetical protein